MTRAAHTTIAISLVLMCTVRPARASEPVTYQVLNAPALADAITPARVPLLEKLNRCDRAHLPCHGALVVPDRWDLDELAYSPMPRHSDLAILVPKMIIVDLPLQAFGAYEWGTLVRWGPVSSGRRDLPTPAGLFHLTWRSRGRHSTMDPDWYLEWYFNFHNLRGLSFHQYALPGMPASHACIRLLERDARWLYGWGEQWTISADRRVVIGQGTPVRVIGAYDFDAPPPWLISTPEHHLESP